MKLMLDTNICIHIIKQQPPQVLKHFAEYGIGDIGISSITLSELRYGVAKSLYLQRNGEALDEFIIPLEVAPFDESAAQVYGKVRVALEKAGTVIGSMDLLIAAHAVSQGVALVTNNTREFEWVAGLTVLNWTK